MRGHLCRTWNAWHVFHPVTSIVHCSLFCASKRVANLHGPKCPGPNLLWCKCLGPSHILNLWTCWTAVLVLLLTFLSWYPRFVGQKQHHEHSQESTWANVTSDKNDTGYIKGSWPHHPWAFAPARKSSHSWCRHIHGPISLSWLTNLRAASGGQTILSLS